MKCIVTIMLAAVVNFSMAQELVDLPVPEVGNPLADITLSNVHYYEKKKLTITDFRGRWLLLNFWAPSCATCIPYLDKLNGLQQHFGKKLAIVLVGLNGGINKNIASGYEKLKIKKQLKLISAYDSVLASAWGIHSVPHIIVVSPEGIVKAVTVESSITEQKISDLISGRDVQFTAKRMATQEYDISKFPGSENKQLVYRSILTLGRNERPSTIPFSSYLAYPEEYRKDGIAMVMTSLERLYMIAYTGGDLQDQLYPNTNFLPKPVLVLKDSTPFNTDPDAGIRFNYNLAVPVARSGDIDYILKIFKQELKNVFGYKVSIEEMEMPVIAVTRTGAISEKVIASGGDEHFDGGANFGATGFRIENYEMKTFVSILNGYLGKNGLPVIDETGIREKISLEIDADMSKLSDIKRELNKYGLDIAKTRRRMKAVVIRDNDESY